MFQQFVTAGLFRTAVCVCPFGFVYKVCKKSKGKVIPFQARCGPEGGYRYSSTVP